MTLKTKLHTCLDKSMFKIINVNLVIINHGK